MYQLKASRNRDVKREGSNKAKQDTHKLVNNTSVVNDEDLEKELLRRNIFQHLSADIKVQVTTQIGACSSKL